MLLKVLAAFTIIGIVVSFIVGFSLKKFVFNNDKDFFKIFILIAIVFIFINSVITFFLFPLLQKFF